MRALARPTADPAALALRALLASGRAVPEPLREAVAARAREGEVVLLALAADPTLAPWLTQPARRQELIDATLEQALGLAAEAFTRTPPGPVALLKGSATARTLYARTALRFRRDVDLLAADVPAARAALLGGPFADHVDANRAAAGPSRVRSWPMAMPTPFGQVEVDLHAALIETGWCRPDPAAILAEAVAMAPLPVTSPRDTVVHTAIHLAENGFRQPLKAWLDLHLLAPTVDPRALAERARVFGARGAVFAALHVTARWFGTPLDAHLEALGVGRAQRAAIAWALSGDGAHPHRRLVERGRARHLARLLVADSLAARAAYLRTRLGLRSAEAPP
ncbi:MAG: nucleotidyltransferase family protein [Myxococcota bacterium]